MAWRTDFENAPKGNKPTLLYRPPPKVGTGDTVVAGRYVTEVDGEAINAWCWHTDVADVYDVDAFWDAVRAGDVYESNDFTHWQPLDPPPEPGE